MEEIFLKGIEEFNARYFFEAHDTWEELWRETTGSGRLFYQGLIQTSVGCYHLINENYKGACSQFGKALAKLENYLPVYHGIDTQRFVDGLRACLLEVELVRQGKARSFNKNRIPHILWSEDQ
jgi:predicted metal-dependent hydrolase